MDFNVDVLALERVKISRKFFEQLNKLQFNERMSALIEFCTHPQSGREPKGSFASSSIQSRVAQVMQYRLYVVVV
jgi:hypothetical protein